MARRALALTAPALFGMLVAGGCTDDEAADRGAPPAVAPTASPSGAVSPSPRESSTPIPPTAPPQQMEGLPFGGADLTNALATAGLDYPLQSESVGCKGAHASGQVYGPRSGPQYVLWVYRTADDLREDWGVAADGSPVSRGISHCPVGEGAVVHENLLLDFRDSRRWVTNEAIRERIVQVFLALDPAAATPRVAVGHPPGTFTGHAVVDAVVEAYIEQDMARLAELARYELSPCATTTINDWYGLPPKCPEGVTPGTPLEVMVVSSCHGAVLVRDDLLNRSPSAALDTRLYAVAVAEGRPDPRAEYLVFFSSRISNGENWGLAYEIGAGGFISHYGGCGATPQETVDRFKPAAFLLPAPALQ